MPVHLCMWWNVSVTLEFAKLHILNYIFLMMYFILSWEKTLLLSHSYFRNEMDYERVGMTKKETIIKDAQQLVAWLLAFIFPYSVNIGARIANVDLQHINARAVYCTYYAHGLPDSSPALCVMTSCLILFHGVFILWKLCKYPAHRMWFVGLMCSVPKNIWNSKPLKSYIRINVSDDKNHAWLLKPDEFNLIVFAIHKSNISSLPHTLSLRPRTHARIL